MKAASIRHCIPTIPSNQTIRQQRTLPKTNCIAFTLVGAMNRPERSKNKLCQFPAKQPKTSISFWVKFSIVFFYCKYRTGTNDDQLGWKNGIHSKIFSITSILYTLFAELCDFNGIRMHIYSEPTQRSCVLIYYTQLEISSNLHKTTMERTHVLCTILIFEAS